MGKYDSVTRGQTECLLNKIGGEAGMRAILSGKATVAYREHVIDLDADPHNPFDQTRVVEHQKGGQFVWDESKVDLCISKAQAQGPVVGYELRKELAERAVVFNANLLDYLLDKPYLIPEQYKEVPVYFWGTIYQVWDSETLFVRCLIFWRGHWEQDSANLETTFTNEDMAMILKAE